MSKFFDYVRKFLALSFMSATAVFLMSCNCDVKGIVQKVDISDISSSLSDKEKKAVSRVMGETFNNKVYKADKDTKNSVLYAVTKDKTDAAAPGECTAIVMEDNATVDACIGSASDGGTQQFNTLMVEPAEKDMVTSLTLDSWDEPVDANPRYISSAAWNDTNPIENFRAINLSAAPPMWIGNEQVGKSLAYVQIDGDKNVYDEKTKTYLAAKSPRSATVRDLTNGLYASSKDTWNDLIKANFEDIAINTGSIKKDGADLDYQVSVNIKDPNTAIISYVPADGNTYYSKIENLKVYPLSQFSNHVLELCKDKMVPDGAANGYADQWKAILTACKDEYAKLSDNAKETKEVNLTIAGNTVVCTPTEVLNTYLSSYVLSSAVRDLCEYKNDENPSTPYTEKAVLESIDNKKLSSEDKQYLLAMISANYDRLDDEFGEKFKKFAKDPVDALVKEINDVPVDDSSKNNEDKKNSDGSSSGSSGSSSGSSSSGSSGKSSPGKSSSIKTGSESLLMLVSSFGLSSGALLSLRKKK